MSKNPFAQEEKASPKTENPQLKRLCPKGTRYRSLRYGTIRFSSGQGGPRGGIKPVDFIKEEFRGRQVQIERNDRTSIVRLVISSFKPTLALDKNLVKRIRAFCRRNKLTNAETHAILFKLGWKYSDVRPSNNRNLDHIRINGYWDDKPKGES